MKFSDTFMLETPPPEDWDTGTFKKSFKDQIKYAMDRATRLGQGSSRVAFEIPFEGRPTVLKIAKNKKGLTQNEIEGDWSKYDMYPSLLIPLIDRDEENDPPRWLHFEKADKLTESKFESIMGYSFKDFSNMIRQHEADYDNRKYGNYTQHMPPEVKAKILEDESLYHELVDLIVNFSLMAIDFTVIQNWGLYENSPVVIDIGLTNDAYESLYRAKPRMNRW